MADATRALHLFAIWCAVQALTYARRPDPRSVEALQIKRLWLAGKATDEDLVGARKKAEAAVWAAKKDSTTAAAQAAVSAASARIEARIEASASARWSALATSEVEATEGVQNRELERLLLDLAPKGSAQ
jgi:hypothetical protein